MIVRVSDCVELENSGHRPPGYVDHVRSLSSEVGGLFVMSDADYVELRGDYENPEVIRKAKEACLQCDVFHVHRQKCLHPKCEVCPHSSPEVVPWLVMNACPAGRW